MTEEVNSSIRTLYNHDAEEAIISQILISPNSYQEISWLKPEHFFNARFSIIFLAFTRLTERGEPIDILTVADELKAMGKLEFIHGSQELARLVSNSPFTYNIENYAESVIDYYNRRKWLEIASQIAKTAYNTGEDLTQKAITYIDKLSVSAQTRQASLPVSDYIDGVKNTIIARMENPTEVWGLPSGFKDFDEATGGIHSSEILLVAGEPGIGKSIFVGQVCLNMARKNYGGIIYSLEMSALHYIFRHLSAISKIPTRKFNTGISESELHKLNTEASTYSKLPLFINDDPSMSTGQIRADLLEMKRKHDIKWFAVDYAYLLDDAREATETERTGLISKSLKTIARELGLAGIVIYSLNKSGSGKNESVRGSFQIVYDADVAMFMLEDKHDKNVVYCKFGKGRHLENARQAFKLVKMPSLPMLGDITYTPDNGNGYKKTQPEDVPF